MEFRVLGPLEVRANGMSVDLGGPTQRALLAALLLREGEVVSVDRLIDELWGDEPPATAVKTLQTHVSRLRRALNGAGEGRLQTRGHGYVLEVRPGELDADRFRDLLEEGRRLLAAGRPETASETLTSALALWRGPVLAGLATGAVAQAEIARLEELRLAATEERVEADLALGRHADLVPELTRMVAEHPLRERLRGQLMLALHQSGRQAEALSAYQSGRRALAEDLGLEPSPGLRDLERRILERDPALAPPRPRRRTPEVPPRRRRIPAAGLAAGLAVVASATVAGALLASGDDDRAAPVRSGVHALDPRTGAVKATGPLGTAPAQVAVGVGSVWTLDADDKTISRIDPLDPSRERTFSTASTPTDIAVGDGAVWVGNASPRATFSNYPTSLSRLDPESGVIDQTIRLPTSVSHPYMQGGGLSRQRIAVTDDALWAVNPDRTLSRIDPRNGRIVARIRDVSAESVAAGVEGVWIVDSGSTPGVAWIDPLVNRVRGRVAIAAESLTGIAVGGGSVWAADPLGGSVWRVTPRPTPVLRQIPLEIGVRGVAFGAGRLWVTNEIAGTVQTIDPRTNRARVVSRLAAAQGVAVGDDRVWVTALGTPPPNEALPSATCRAVSFAGSGIPRVLITSSMPLQGGARAGAVAIVDGIRFTLERRGYRAGPYSVGYRSCDDSTAQSGGTDVSRCFSNARAYARAPAVVGVIGAYQSFCSSFQIPVANQAPGGPLAMISPSNTDIRLTRRARGMPAAEIERMYPTGRRNYVRIAAADHLAAAGMVQAAKDLRRPRVFLMWDRRDPSMDEFASDMRAAARARGLEVVGAAGWDPNARGFAGLVRLVAAAKPEAVLMAGAAPPATQALLGDLRAGLGREPALIASDGFAGFVFDPSERPGRAAVGMYVANYGIPNAALPPAGRRLLDAAGRTGDDQDFTFAYGAQAAEILLDAIGRSDGTRASVTRELLATDVKDGILGNIRFDERGDLVSGPVTIYRLGSRKAEVDRVIAARFPGRD